MQCPNCSFNNRPNAKFCAGCQTQLPQATPPYAQQPPPAYIPPTVVDNPPNNLRPWLIGGIVVLSLLIVGALALMFLLGDGDDGGGGGSDTPTPTVESDESVTPSVTPVPIVVPTSTVTGTVELTATVVATATVEITGTASAATPEPPPPTTNNLLTNGNFQEDWSVGWQRRLGPNSTGTQAVEVVDVENGRAARITRSGPDQLALAQLVPVNAQTRFRGRVQLQGSGEGDIEGVGTLMLIYYGSNLDFPLGWSIWMSGDTREVPLFGRSVLPPIGPNVSLRFVGAEWTNIDILIQQEVRDRLPLVNPESVQQVEVILLAVGSDGCAGTACNATATGTDFALEPVE